MEMKLRTVDKTFSCKMRSHEKIKTNNNRKQLGCKTTVLIKCMEIL